MDETLIKQVAQLTGLPTELIENQLHKMALSQGVSPRQISVDQLRAVLVNLLQDVFTAIKDGEDPTIEIYKDECY